LSDSVIKYAALPLPLACQPARARIMCAIENCGEQITRSRQAERLIVLPEYVLTGYPEGESTAEWQAKACIREDGPEYEALGKLAQQHGIYLSGNTYEVDANFPELYFQTSFIISDSGNVILRYRRLISMTAPTPHDVLDSYLDIYGSDSLFPVVDTELGRLACVASEEILYPEITRAHALRGAEVICHSNSEIEIKESTPGYNARQVRAYENMVFIVSASSAVTRAESHSEVVDYSGSISTLAGHHETRGGDAEIDISALRRARVKTSMTNTLARLRLGVFRHAYDTDPVYPKNTLISALGVKTPSQNHYLDTQQSVIDSLIERGII